ncbi:MAG: anthranilate synthase component I family protein [Micromonosporaceae bacterium]|nr:anthranilate synthase component I family protein [Micromonosporaceae bacterium]
MRGGSGAYAYVGGYWCTGLADLTDDPSCLDSRGFWVVVAEFTLAGNASPGSAPAGSAGSRVFARFDRVRRAPRPAPAGPWYGPPPGDWSSSLGRREYLAGVAAIRRYIEAGEVYQANLCRVLSAPLAAPREGSAGGGQPGGDLLGLADRLATGNPAPYAAVVELPVAGVRLVCASPELYLRRTGEMVESSPIKGTGRTAADLLAKDLAENVMIVDLVRNDLSRVAATGGVSVPSLLQVQPHPGLVHLVSTVRARLRTGVGWPELLAASFPPGSVTGAPKLAALAIIGALEPVPRGPYCGAVGYVDADRRTGVLAVAIRTFWIAGDRIHFGTGAGITWGSDPAAEWAETQLKAANLVRLASAGPGVARPDTPLWTAVRG